MMGIDPIGRLYDALRNGDIAAMRACCAADVRVWHCFDGIEQSLDQACDGWAQLIDGTAARGIDHVVQRRAGDVLVQQHDFWMETRDAQRSAWHVCLVVRIEDDCIMRIDEYIDRAARFPPTD
jgi:ketosteroid isomerase-like protein